VGSREGKGYQREGKSHQPTHYHEPFPTINLSLVHCHRSWPSQLQWLHRLLPLLHQQHNLELTLLRLLALFRPGTHLRPELPAPRRLQHPYCSQHFSPLCSLLCASSNVVRLSSSILASAFGIQRHCNSEMGKT
jgi:hypothetical protein